MKKLFLITLSLLMAGALQAIPTRVTFTDGPVTVTFKNGKTRDLNIGDVLNTGDTVRTGKKGLAELNQKDVVVKVSGATVFTLGEKSLGGQNRAVLEVALGSVKMKYDKLTGQEPLLRTATVAMGVRGTELEIWAGADGTSLLAVTSGLVALESMGKVVEVGAGEAVEVLTGQVPGDKFALKSQAKAYENWNQDRIKSMTAQPMKALESMETQLSAYGDQIDVLNKEYLAKRDILEKARAQRVGIFESQGAEAAQAFETQNVEPLIMPTLQVFVNLRYTALAAYSLRHYVAGRLYAMVKPALSWGPADQSLEGFQNRYENFLKNFETRIVPHLVEADF